MSDKRNRWRRKRDKRRKKRQQRVVHERAESGSTSRDDEGGVAIGGLSVSPADGALVMTCDHVGSGHNFHWWHCPEGMEFTRPDGSKGETHWMAACNPCFLKAEGDPDKIEFRDDWPWDAQGGKPMKVHPTPDNN